jgi:predicted secreted protein
MARYAAKGLILGVDDTTTPGTFTPVAQIRNLSGPTMGSDALDVSSHDSPNFDRQFLQGMKDPGEVTLELIFDPADATQAGAPDADSLLDLYVRGVQNTFRITWSDTGATIWEFTAFVQSYETDGPFDDVLTASVTLKLSGSLNFAAT